MCIRDRYLYDEKNLDVLPEYVLDGYRIGARQNDSLKLLISVGGATTEYSSRIVMGNSQTSSEKSFNVGRNSVGINSIGTYSQGGVANVITLSSQHTLQNGESVRVLSETGQLPDGLTPNTVYYAITNTNVNSGLTTTINIKLANSLNEANNGTEIAINNGGGPLKIVSRVSDKAPGDIGHPIGFDTTKGQWFIKVATASTDNAIHSRVVGLGTTYLGSATSRTYINRKRYNRNANDSIYRVRYVLPANNGADYARPPSDGFILQESNTSISPSTTEIQKYFGTGDLSNVNELRNFRFIAGANWSAGTNLASIDTELPHNLRIGSQVEIVNVKSTLNVSGIGNSGYNGTYTVSGISSAKTFSVGLSTNPGTFTNDTSSRNTSLPYFKKKKYNNTYYVYRNQEAQKYIPDKQDGIYYLTCISISLH